MLAVARYKTHIRAKLLTPLGSVISLYKRPKKQVMPEQDYYFDTSKGKDNVSVSASDLLRNPMVYYDVSRTPHGFLLICRLVANRYCMIGSGHGMDVAVHGASDADGSGHGLLILWRVQAAVGFVDDMAVADGYGGCRDTGRHYNALLLKMIFLILASGTCVDMQSLSASLITPSGAVPMDWRLIKSFCGP